MFKTIFNKGDEKERFYHYFMRFAFNRKPHISIVPYFFNFNIVPDKFDLFG